MHSIGIPVALTLLGAAAVLVPVAVRRRLRAPAAVELPESDDWMTDWVPWRRR